VCPFPICTYSSSSSFLGSTAQPRPWPPPQNPAEFLGGFSTIYHNFRSLHQAELNSQVSTPAMWQKKKLLGWGDQWHNLHTKFRENRSICSRNWGGYRDTYTARWRHKFTFFAQNESITCFLIMTFSIPKSTFDTFLSDWCSLVPHVCIPHSTPHKGKSKVFLVPWRRIGGVEVYLHSFFDLDTRWRWVVSFTPRPLTPRDKVPGTHWIGGWVGPQSRFGHGNL
jgi:hypothetical protein